MNIVNDTSSSLKFDEAKSMKFGTSAGSGKTLLGGTLIFNTSIANKYDKMGGVSVVYNPFDL